MTTDDVATDATTSASPSPVTLRVVAREAGVALATASRALDPQSRYVAEDVRRRVRETAERLGYRPNASARATTTGSAPTIAVLVSDIRDPYNAKLVHGAIEAAQPAGLMVTINGTEHVIDDEIRVVRMLRSQRPMAMMLTGTRTGNMASRTALLQEIERYQQDGGRVVVAGDDEFPFDTAVVPRRAGARALITELARVGYASFALVASDVESVGTREWEAGVVEGARQAGVRIDHVTTMRAPMTRDGGFAAASRMLLDGHRVDAILAPSDTMAIGVMSAARAAGLTPGQDIGVAGFDDVFETDDITPGLSSVDLALEKVGRSAVDLLLTAPTPERRRVTFEPRVALRATTPPRR